MKNSNTGLQLLDGSTNLIEYKNTFKKRLTVLMANFYGNLNYWTFQSSGLYLDSFCFVNITLVVVPRGRAFLDKRNGW